MVKREQTHSSDRERSFRVMDKAEQGKLSDQQGTEEGNGKEGDEEGTERNFDYTVLRCDKVN